VNGPPPPAGITRKPQALSSGRFAPATKYIFGGVFGSTEVFAVPGAGKQKTQREKG